MKIRTKELDVDFIGGQNNPWTKDEQIAISAFIRQQKGKRRRNIQTKSKKQPSPGKVRTSGKALA